MINKFILILIKFLNKITRKKKIILFYSSFGFDDNSRALYNKMKNDVFFSSHKFVWLVDNKKKYNHFNERCKFYSKKSLLGIYYFVHAKYVIKTHSIFDNAFNKKKQIVLYCMHGMPIKGLNKNVDTSKLKDYNFCSIYPVTSKNYYEIINDIQKIPREKMINSGLPRNDFLFEKNNILTEMNLLNFHKIIIWMPTFRKTKNSYFNDGKNTDLGIPVLSEEELLNIDVFLKSKNMLLIIKLHPWAIDSTIDFNKYENIMLLTNDDIPYPYVMYNLLAYCDALITDYSSVYIDYLLLENHIGFAYDDFKEYSKSRNWAFEDIEKYMVGYKLQCYYDFISFFEDVYSGTNKYIVEEKKINEFFNDYRNGGYSNRLLMHLKNIINQEEK